MGMKIIEVALALVTLYLVMALAATQISELWAAAFRRRPKVLGQIVGEAFDGQPALIDAFFAYAPIYALSKGKDRPAAIPADLFATAFLAVLNGNKPPRTAFRSPAEFVAASENANPRLKQVLEAHVTGAEADWDAFEARLARWYDDICDRAEGWYKRETTLRLLLVSIGMSVLLNADSGHIARSLLENDSLRVSIADIGELLFEQRNQQAAGGNPPAPQGGALADVGEDTARASVSNELDRALGEMRAALEAVPALGAYGDSVGSAARDCVDDEAAYKNKLYDSNYEAWSHLVASIIGKVDRASLGIRGDDPFLEEAQGRIRSVRQAMFCTSAISTWVRKALGEPRNKNAQPHLSAAIAALDRALGYMEALVERAAFPNNLARSYALLGQDFVDCANAAGKSRAAFEHCLGTAQTTSLPFGWPGQAGQFCRMTLHDPGARILDANALPTDALPAVNRDRAGRDAWFGCQDYEGNSTLDLPVIYANVTPWKVVAAILGWLTTALLVSLGAPFWYDVLGKVAPLRIAGRVRGLGQAPAASPATGAGAGAGKPATGTPPPAPAGPAAPFDSAVNEFERGLRPNEISRLQIALGMPPTMHLDEATRHAIAARLKDQGQPPERELSSATYYLIVGRNAAQAGKDTASAALWPVGTRDPVAVPQLIAALNRLFPYMAQALPAGDVYTHELRARAVLFRFKSDPAASAIQKKMVTLAASPRGELMQLDDAARRAILASGALPAFAPEQQAWLDYAFGELGIIENSREGLARIDEYLAAVDGQQVPGRAATTAWCGGFVGWVLYQAGKFANGAPRPQLLQAARWAGYGTASQGNPGDVCVVDGRHVAFLVGFDAQQRPWLLGGNQGLDGSGGVTLVPFKATANIVYVPIGQIQ